MRGKTADENFATLPRHILGGNCALMKKKIVALMAVIPLILIFTVFSVSGAVSLAISIPVASIKIENKQDGVIVLDQAAYDDNFKLDVHVNPLNAANKGYTKTLELLDEPLGDASEVLTVQANNTVKLKDKIGRVKLTYTSNDGGYTDSVILIATSSKVMSLSATATTFSDTTPIDTATSGTEFLLRADVYPVTATDLDVLWSSSDDSIVAVNSVTGIATALTSGVATLTATCHDAIRGQLTSSTEVTVTQASTPSQITVNGKDEHKLTFFNQAKSLSFLLETPIDFKLVTESDNSYIANDDITITQLSSPTQTTIRLKVVIAVEGDILPTQEVVLTFKDSNFPELEPYKLTLGFTDTITFMTANSSEEILKHNNCYLELSTKRNFTIIPIPAVENLTFKWNSSNESVATISANKSGEICKVSTTAATGETDMTVKAYLNGESYQINVGDFQIITKQSYTSLVLKENSLSWGISKQFAIGDKVVDKHNGTNKLLDFDYELQLYAQNNLTTWKSGDVDFSALEWTSSDANIAIVEKREGKGHFLNILSTGEVTLTVEWTDAERFGKNVVESLTLYCVKDGVNVHDYTDIIFATKAGHKVILMDNIMLGEDLSNYSTEKAVQVLKSQVDSIATTADDSYYLETEGRHPTVNYCIEFTNDVFGNGYFLNANNITNYNDGSARISDKVFNGPLNMVNLVGVASVKAQDNIVYLVKRDNITIDNIELMGCNDVADLTELNKIGTTLEVLSSGVKLINSRVKNGRTVLRYFGNRYDDSATVEQLKGRPMDTLRVESCMLSCAREFIVKIGTNAAAKNNAKSYGWNGQNSEKNYRDFAPKLTDANGNCYEPRLSANADDDYFSNNYIKTQVTLKNSVLATSGLFSVGMESKFAGPLLFGYKIAGIELEGWSELAGTSFSALLKLEGDVRIYDWKNLQYIDSSSLIEVDSNISSEHSSLSMFKLDIAQMVLDATNSSAKYSDLLLTQNALKFAHGGIAFYGGGCNYNIVDTKNFNGEAMQNVVVDMDINETMSALKLAAGDQPFHFLMYGNDSEFNLAKQLLDQNSGTAYSWIPVAAR